MTKLTKKQLFNRIRQESDKIVVPQLSDQIKNKIVIPETIQNESRQKYTFKVPFRLATLALLLVVLAICIPAFLMKTNPSTPTNEVSLPKTQLMMQATSLFNLASGTEAATSLATNYSLIDDVENIDYDASAKEIFEYLAMVEEFFNEDKNSYEIIELNTGEYKYKATINLNLNGSAVSYNMYFNETALEEDYDDIDEVSSSYEGYIEHGSIQYFIEGKKEIENDECEVELKLYLDKAANDFIVLNQETEKRENEFSYEIFKGGLSIKELEIQLNIEDGVASKTIELEEKDKIEKTTKEFEFKYSEEVIECNFELNDQEAQVYIKMYQDYYEFDFGEGNIIRLNRGNFDLKTQKSVNLI